MNGLFEFRFGLIVWQIVILSIALLVLGKYAWRPILGFIQKQEQAYLQAAQAAEEQHKLTQALQRQSEDILKRANEDSQHILEKALASKKELLEQAKLEARQMREEMRSQAQKDILQEKQATVKVLKKQLGMLTVQIAEKLLQRELSEKNKQDSLLQILIAQTNTSTSSSYKTS